MSKPKGCAPAPGDVCVGGLAPAPGSVSGYASTKWTTYAEKEEPLF